MAKVVTGICLSIGALAGIFAIAESNSAKDVGEYLWPGWTVGILGLAPVGSR